MTRLLEEVALAVQEVAAAVLEPAFDRREELQVWEKSAGEVVTAADVEAERRLGLRLAELQPGVPMVGEEARAREPTLSVKRVAEAPRVWLVDPLDTACSASARCVRSPGTKKRPSTARGLRSVTPRRCGTKTVKSGAAGAQPLNAAVWTARAGAAAP